MILKQVKLLLLAAITMCCLTSSQHQVSVFIVGDSTAADKKDPANNPERGWGMMLQGYFDEGVTVRNFAVNGRSSKSFMEEGRWNKVLEQIKPGDYVLIQFGHNDEKAGTDRYTIPGSTFDAYLSQYVREAREKGGIPVLLNSVVRRNFYQHPDTNVDDETLRNTTYADETINSDTLVDTHGAYKDVPAQLANSLGTYYIDANKLTHDLEQRLGVIGSRQLHMWFKPGEIPSIPEGRHDNTHYNVYGARCVARLLADALGQSIPKLRKHVVHFDYVVSAAGRGNFMQLQQAIDAAPTHTAIYVLDGQWNISRQQLKDKQLKVISYPGASVHKY
ncbi:MAG: rhamnogalacturonan acetylesterase [Prevotella sp.]|nr:rhamnogalacturonan acetylesterase [Prevotella sp.]